MIKIREKGLTQKKRKKKERGEQVRYDHYL